MTDLLRFFVMWVTLAALAGCGGGTAETTAAAGASGSRVTEGGAGAVAANDAGAAGLAGAAGAAGAAGSAMRAGSGGSGGTGGLQAAPEAGRAAGAGGAGAESKPSIYRPCPEDGACKIMPFGDSITDGYNQDTPGGYRVELFRLATSAGKDITFVGSGSNGPNEVAGAAFPHNHEGHSGWTIAPAGGRSGVSTLVSNVMPQYKPDIVLLMIGTNDAIDNYEMDRAPERLSQLIDAVYDELPDVLIVVATLIPGRADAGQGDDVALNARIERFNKSIPALVEDRIAAGKHILTVDMYTPFVDDARDMLEDQWHPNLAGYELIGAEWYKTIEDLL